MSRQNDEQDIYIIPQNFIEGGKLFGGMFRVRNAVEALALALATGLPIMQIHATLYTRIVLLCIVPLPLALFGLIGIGDKSLSEFVINFFIWLKRRRIIGNDPDQIEEKPRWWKPGWLRALFEKIRTRLPARKVEPDEEAFEIVYYDSEDEI